MFGSMMKAIFYKKLLQTKINKVANFSDSYYGSAVLMVITKSYIS